MLVTLCCCLGTLPLLNGHPPATSDGLYHLLRAVELDRQLHAGVWLPRWAPDFYLGYGYPIFFFTPLLPYYLVELAHLVGLPFLSAMAVVEAAALVASGLLAYAWLGRHLPATAAAVGAVLYALAPYHLVNLYFRGDLSEFVAAAWFPAILLAIELLLARPGPLRIVVLAVTLAGLLLTHFLSALVFLPVALVVALVGLAWRKPAVALHQAVSGLAAGVLGAALAAESWLPAVTSSADATFAKLLRFYNYRANFATPGQLFSLQPLHEYSYVFAGSQHFGYQFGLLQSVAGVAGLGALVLLWRRLAPPLRARTIALAPVGGVALLGCLSLAAPLWSALPAVQLIQFPWRLLAIAALPAAWLAAVAIAAVPVRARLAIGVLACAAVTASSLLLLRPLRMAPPTDQASAQGISRFELLYHLAGTSAAAEYLPPWATARQTTSALAFSRAIGITPPADPAASVTRRQPAGGSQRFTLDQPADGDATLPLLYFPGWQATLDGQAAPLHPASGSGLATLHVPAGPHTVVVAYAGTPVVRLGAAVSVGALVVLVGLGAAGGWRRRAPRAEAPGLGPKGPPRSRLEAGSGPLARFSGLCSIKPWASALGIVLLCLLALSMGALGSRASAGAWQPLVASLAGGVRVTGYAFDSHPPDDAGTASAPAGSTVHLHLAGTTPVGTRLAIRLTDAADTDWADWQTALGSGQADVALALPPDMPPGLYTVRLGAGQDGSANFNLAAAQLVRLLPINGTLDIGPLIVTPAMQPTPRQTSVAPAAWPDRVRLLTPIVPRSVHAGEALSLQWVWQAAGRWRATERLTEAVHLIDANGHVLDAADMEPDGGYYPTTFWQPNERILDHPSLAVPADTPPGSYAVSVELLSGGHTLPAQSDTGTPLGDAVVVGHVDILPPATPAPFGGASVSVGPLRVQLTEAPGPAVPGTALAVPLRWHLPAAPIAGQSLTLELQQSNRVLASTTIQPGGASYPLSRWRTGETERQVVDLPIPAGAPPGPADLILMGSPDGTPQRLGTVTIAGRPHVFTASPTVVLNLPFANGSVLLGFDLRADGATVGQGQTPTARRSLDVTLYWKAGGPTPSPLKVTVQLLDATNHLAAQDDTEPEGGRAPSTSWLAGEVITSTHHVDLAKTPAGTYRLITALYDAKTGARVATAGGNTAALTTVAVP